MRVRKQDPITGDMVFGGSQLAFWANSADAVGQIISTRLKFYQGEWFLDTSDGTPWDTKILGNRTDSTRDPVIQARVLGTPNVASISNYNSHVVSPDRVFNAAMMVTTDFGVVEITTNLVNTNTAGPPHRQYLTPQAQSPYSILVSWQAIPIFTLDSPEDGILDSNIVLG